MNQLRINEKSEFYFCSAGNFIALNNPTHPRRCLDSAVLLLGRRGSNPIGQDGRDYILTEGSFMLLFPGYEHYGYAPASDAASYFWCHFYLPPEPTEGTLLLPEYGVLQDPKPYYILFHQMIDAANKEYSSPESAVSICSAYLKIILTGLAEDYRKESSEGELHRKRRMLASRVTEWIRLHCEEKISPKTVADSFHYNTDYLTQAFKAETGMTLGEAINRSRVEKAKQFLQNTDMRISEIAALTGFEDDKYFMKTFKKYESVTPSEYRQSYFRIHINHS